VISDWAIDGNQSSTSDPMVWIEKDGFPRDVENVHIFNLSAGRHNQAVQVGEYPNIVMTQTCDDSSRGVESRHAYGIKIEEGRGTSSSRRTTCDSMRTANGFTGRSRCATRNNVTFRWNHIDAYTSGDSSDGGPPLERLFRQRSAGRHAPRRGTEHGGERDGGRHRVREFRTARAYGATSSMWNMSSRELSDSITRVASRPRRTPMKPRSRRM